MPVLLFLTLVLVLTGRLSNPDPGLENRERERAQQDSVDQYDMNAYNSTLLTLTQGLNIVS